MLPGKLPRTFPQGGETLGKLLMSRSCPELDSLEGVRSIPKVYRDIVARLRGKELPRTCRSYTPLDSPGSTACRSRVCKSSCGRARNESRCRQLPLSASVQWASKCEQQRAVPPVRNSKRSATLQTRMGRTGMCPACRSTRCCQVDHHSTLPMVATVPHDRDFVPNPSLLGSLVCSFVHLMLIASAQHDDLDNRHAGGTASGKTTVCSQIMQVCSTK